jgi:hypothetical protein
VESELLEKDVYCWSSEGKQKSLSSALLFFSSLSSLLSRPLLFIGLRKKFQPYLLGMVIMYEDNYYFKFASCLVG